MSFKIIPGYSAFMKNVKEAAERKKAAQAKIHLRKPELMLYKAGDLLRSNSDGSIHQVTKVLKGKIYYSENADGTGPLHWDTHKIIRECFTLDRHRAELNTPPAEKAPVEKKPLFLIMEKVWFDEIYSGRKKTEYRDDSPFYRARFINKKGQFRHYETAILQVGYHKDARRMTVEIKDIILDGGFEISLGKILDQNF